MATKGSATFSPSSSNGHRKVKAECPRRMYLPIPEQGQWLGAVVRGHLNYFAVPGNIKAVEAFRDQATRHWYHAFRQGLAA